MLTIHVWPKRLKEFLLTHPLYKSPTVAFCKMRGEPLKKSRDFYCCWSIERRKNRAEVVSSSLVDTAYHDASGERLSQP